MPRTAALFTAAITVLFCFLLGYVPPAPADSTACPPGKPDHASGETLVIDGVEYLIQPPWTGHRMPTPTLPADSFRRIPVEYTFNGSRLHVHVSAFDPLLALLRHARRDGIELTVESGYRSERYQRSIFSKMMQDGRTFADIIRFVAPPGYSQHQLGTAVDFYPSDWHFASTPAYSWLQENAAAYHFEQTYRQNNPAGIPWEAWHWNFIGGPGAKP